ncbi:hypothetical protein DH2020_015798 [Rehmannia glutinosa]|uniref:Uncharacterized protein n=1 Tax=Rehmannia glutinosa TaxID=99300 RepID=A0ABR0WV88_REHGL
MQGDRSLMGDVVRATSRCLERPIAVNIDHSLEKQRDFEPTCHVKRHLVAATQRHVITHVASIFATSLSISFLISHITTHGQIDISSKESFILVSIKFIGKQRFMTQIACKKARRDSRMHLSGGGWMAWWSMAIDISALKALKVSNKLLFTRSRIGVAIAQLPGERKELIFGKVFKCGEDKERRLILVEGKKPPSPKTHLWRLLLHGTFSAYFELVFGANLWHACLGKTSFIGKEGFGIFNDGMDKTSIKLACFILLSWPPPLISFMAFHRSSLLLRKAIGSTRTAAVVHPETFKVAPERTQ